MFVVYGSINKVPAMYDPCHHRGVLTPRAAVNSPGYNEPFTSFQWTDKVVAYKHYTLTCFLQHQQLQVVGCSVKGDFCHLPVVAN